MTEERIAELMGWPASWFQKEQCGPEDFLIRIKNLVATAEREEREKADARIADLERKLKEANQLSDAVVPLCYEHQEKISDLERKLACARGEK